MEPLRTARNITNIVIVIDALDECVGDVEKRRQLMTLLMERAATLPENFRIFITARNGDADLESALKDARYIHQFYLPGGC